MCTHPIAARPIAARPTAAVVRPTSPHPPLRALYSQEAFGPALLGFSRPAVWRPTETVEKAQGVAPTLARRAASVGSRSQLDVFI